MIWMRKPRGVWHMYCDESPRSACGLSTFSAGAMVDDQAERSAVDSCWRCLMKAADARRLAMEAKQ